MKVLFDELAQRVDGCAGRRRSRVAALCRLERDRIASPARASGRQPRHLDRDQREQSAHRDTKTGAGEKALLVQLDRQFRQPVALGLAQRDHRLGRKRFETCERLALAIAHRLGDIFGEAHDPSVGESRAEAKAMGDGGRHENRTRRIESDGGGFEGHLAAAALDQQNLKQIAVAVRANGPVVNRGTRGDRLDMNEVEGLIVRRIAVEVKQRERGRGHAKS